MSATATVPINPFVFWWARESLGASTDRVAGVRPVGYRAPMWCGEVAECVRGLHPAPVVHIPPVVPALPSPPAVG